MTAQGKQPANVLKEREVLMSQMYLKSGLWLVNGKPKKIMHDNGKQFTSKIFKRFLEHNNMKDKPIPNFYPNSKESRGI